MIKNKKRIGETLSTAGKPRKTVGVGGERLKKKRKKKKSRGKNCEASA